MPSGASPRATIVNATRTLGVIASFGAAACHAPSFSRAALAYLPTGTSRTSPVTIQPSPRELGKIKVRSDRDTVEFGILWCDQHKSVAQQIEPRVVLDELP